VTYRIEISARRFRIFLANLAIALGWSLRGSKLSAQRLLPIARWLVPEAQRFLVHHTGSHCHHQRIFKFAADLGTLLRHRQSFRVAAGFLIVLVLLGSLELATRATAIGNQPLADSAFSVSTQSEPVPLPTRKPQGVYKLPNKSELKAATQNRMAQQKSARKRMPERQPLVGVTTRFQKPSSASERVRTPSGVGYVR
jgi:hypothetical protein